MNTVTIIGNLTKQPEIVTVGDTTVTKFTIADNKYVKKGEHPEATFWRCSFWGKFGETFAGWVTKGSLVSVTGEASLSTYTDKNGATHTQLEVNVDRAKNFSKSESSDNNTRNTPATAPKPIEVKEEETSDPWSDNA